MTTDPMDELKRLAEARARHKADPSCIAAFKLVNELTTILDLPAILRAWEADRAIVEKLPKTADGAAVVPGESVWATDGDGLVLEAYIDPVIWPREGYRTRSWRPSVTYSALEAALAAKATSH